MSTGAGSTMVGARHNETVRTGEADGLPLCGLFCTRRGLWSRTCGEKAPARSAESRDGRGIMRWKRIVGKELVTSVIRTPPG